MAIDYVALLAELRAEEQQLQKDIDAVRSAIAGAEVMARKQPLLSLPFREIMSNRPYEGMGTKQAILRLLADTPKPIMPMELSRILIERGVKSSANDFAGNVSSTLTQMRQEGIIDRLEDGWVITMRPDPMGNPPMNVQATDPIWMKIATVLRLPSAR